MLTRNKNRSRCQATCEEEIGVTERLGEADYPEVVVVVVPRLRDMQGSWFGHLDLSELSRHAPMAKDRRAWRSMDYKQREAV